MFNPGTRNHLGKYERLRIMSLLVDRVYEELRRDGPLSQKEMLDRLGCARRSLFSALRRLDDEGRIERKPDFRDLRRSVFVARRG
jgi:DNA-binding MarR family transcriptional regulator